MYVTLELRRGRPAEARDHITLKSRGYTAALEVEIIMLRYNRAVIFASARDCSVLEDCDVIYANTTD